MNSRNDKSLQSKIKIIYSDKTAEENREKYKHEYEKYKELHDSEQGSSHKTIQNDNSSESESKRSEN